MFLTCLERLFYLTYNQFTFYYLRIFYLSIHNLHILNATIVKSGTVPVVMGPPRRDYERLAPPNSFIHISDFDGPKDLTQYLIYLEVYI